MVSILREPNVIYFEEKVVNYQYRKFYTIKHWLCKNRKLFIGFGDPYICNVTQLRKVEIMYNHTLRVMYFMSEKELSLVFSTDMKYLVIKADNIYIYDLEEILININNTNYVMKPETIDTIYLHRNDFNDNIIIDKNGYISTYNYQYMSGNVINIKHYTSEILINSIKKKQDFVFLSGLHDKNSSIELFHSNKIFDFHTLKMILEY